MSNKIMQNRTYIRKKRRARIIILVLVLLFMLIVGLGVSVFATMPYDEIDLCNLAVVEFGGYNTAGTASVSIDDAAVDAFLSMIKEKHDNAIIKSDRVNDEDYLKFRQSLSASIDKTSGLSNGSVIVMHCNYDKKLAKALKIDVTSIERKINVGGLPTVTILSVDQLFEDLEVTFSGISPNLTIGMKNNSDHPFISKMVFEIVNPKEFYAAGDTVSIRAVFDDELTQETHFVVEAPVEDCVKDYVASSTSKYISTAHELPKYIIDEAIAAGKGAFKDANEYGVRIFCEAHLVPVYINKKATFVYGTPNVVSAYFKTVFPEKAGQLGYSYNDLDIIYSVVISQADGVACTAYAAVRFSDIIVNEDGSYSYDFSNPKILTESYVSGRVKKNVTDSYVASYDIEKVR